MNQTNLTNETVHEVPSFVNVSATINVEDVAGIIATNEEVYVGLQPVKLILDVEGNGLHILYKAVSEHKRFGMITFEQITRIPLSYAVFKVDGAEIPMQAFNIREMMDVRQEELDSFDGVLELTKDGETVNVKQMEISKESK